jgi:hypothetical protein
MVSRFLVGGLMLFAFTIAAPAGDKPTAKAAPAPRAGLDRMKKLVGTWVMADKEGKPTDQVVSVIKVTAGGSVVHETLFPDQPHEMVSVYKVAGGDLVMTHYCMLGNQPELKADPKSPANQICFKFAGGSNIDPVKDKHMHDSTFTFIDDDHIHISGTAWEDGKPVKGTGCDMTLVRKK